MRRLWGIVGVPPRGLDDGVADRVDGRVDGEQHGKAQCRLLEEERDLLEVRGSLEVHAARHREPQRVLGEVVAVGKGKRLEDGKVIALDVKAGDRILFGKYTGQAVKVEGTEYLVMREDDIMGIVAK